MTEDIARGTFFYQRGKASIAFQRVVVTMGQTVLRLPIDTSTADKAEAELEAWADDLNWGAKCVECRESPMPPEDGHDHWCYIPLTNSYTQVKISVRDLERVSKRSWRIVYINGKNFPPYVATSIKTEKGSRLLLLHRFVMDATEDVVVDHVQGMTMDNRRSRLRMCPQHHNAKNRAPTRGRDLPKGVSRQGNRFRARLTHDGVVRKLGTFDTPEEAAAAYNDAARKHFGQFHRSDRP